MNNCVARMSMNGSCLMDRQSRVTQSLDVWRCAVRFGRGVWRGLAATALVAMTIVPTHAADWIESSYNPAVGSRWTIEMVDRAAETKPDGGALNTIFNGRAEMTIDEKTTEGFRISYVARQISVEGNSPNVPVLRAYCKMLENILIRATLDATGKPVRIDNFDAVKTEMHKEMERLQRSGENSPRQLLALSMIMSDLVSMDPERAAPSFLTELVTLAKSQNTGMKVGEVRRSTDPADNPLGTTLRSETAFSLSEIDVEKRTATYHEVRAFDEGSVKDFIYAHSRAVLAKSEDKVTPDRIERLVKATSMSLDGKGLFIVENGMTRDVEEMVMTTASADGKVSSKVKSKTIKITLAP